jgi:hypothetical protein
VLGVLARLALVPECVGRALVVCVVIARVAETRLSVSLCYEKSAAWSCRQDIQIALVGSASLNHNEKESHTELLALVGLKEVLGVGNELRSVSFIMHSDLVACQGAILTFSMVFCS